MLLACSRAMNQISTRKARGEVKMLLLRRGRIMGPCGVRASVFVPELRTFPASVCFKTAQPFSKNPLRDPPGSRVKICTTVLRIPSEQGRHKAFSTCLLTWPWSPCSSAPEVPLHLLPIPGSGAGSAALSGASSSEPPHLQHEEPGAQGCS